MANFGGSEMGCLINGLDGKMERIMGHDTVPDAG